MIVRPIENIEQLRAEIQLLKQKRAEQELYFLHKKESLTEALKSPFTFIKKMGLFFGVNKSKSAAIGADWTTALARFIVPFILNKTILRGKGGLLKSLFTLASQKVINPSVINQHKIASVAGKVSDFVSMLLQKSRRKKRVDYGIPPDSETY